MSTAAHPTALAAVPTSRSRTVARSAAAAGVPWYIWTVVAGVTSATIGGAWDVAWHRSIGRDTFWTPAHLMIQLCGVLAGIVGLWLVYQCTFRRDAELRPASVSIFGLRAPLGVFLAGWGGLAMVTSAPFDNWWHNAYGLDVKIVSPPHTLLILGIRAVSLGVFFLILAAMNRAATDGSASFSTLQKLLLYLGGLTVGGQMFFLQEYTWDVMLHQTQAYIAMGIAIPVALAVISQASRFRWAATVAAATYMAFIIGEILIFPLVHAEPKLGPVFNPVTHLVPAKFPVLLIVPAIALDLLWRRAKSWKTWQIAVVSGVVFTAVLVAVEWPFAKFLLSKASENRFFGTTYFDYNSRPDGVDRMRQFFHPAYGLPLYLGLLQAAVCAVLSTWVGLVFGRWMRGVQR
ncbi:hypothetical protein [Terriglobus aquaticus]|uniref:Prokaryotic molybdopterin-containing oxidoreductase family, membrane subunit n=1 Tax=Terriglobus aquaticus TaxID=940139 RepID=A0ABW9KQ98_9BACT|nr:hypothetical protein [Terriglobus aquaticus]